MKYLFAFTFIVMSIFLNAQSAYEFNKKGDYYWEQGDYETAIANYTKAINLKKEPLYYYNRGYSKENLGRYDAAIVDYSKAIKLNSRYFDAYNNRGFCYDNLGKYEAAIADYSAAIKLKPNFVDAYNNRGYAKRQLKQFEAAVEDYSKALKIDGTFEVAYNNRGSARNELGEYELAVKDFDKAIALNSKDANTYNNRGTANFYLREYEAAILDYDKAIVLRPNFKEAYFHRGSAKYYLNENEAALVDINKALKIDPYFDLALKRQKMIISSLKYQKRVEADSIAFEQAIKENKVRIIPPKSKLALKWGQTELINNTVTTQNNIKVKVESSEKGLDKNKFVLFINGDSINNAVNITFENQIFSAEIPLRAGVNDIYVVYEKAYTTLLRIVFKPERSALYTMIVGADVSAKAYNYKNSTNFSDLFDKQFLLYNERNAETLEANKMTSKKIKQGLNSIKTKKNNRLGNDDDDVVITYISSFSYVAEDNNLLLTAYDFNPKKLKKTTFTVTELMGKINSLKCQKILFLDIQLNEDYSEAELELIKNNLQEQAKNNGFSLFASIQNQSDYKILANENSVFTDALIKGMIIKADLNQDKIISTLELSNYLEKQALDNLVIEVKNDFSLVIVE